MRLLHDKIGSELALCQYCSFIVKCGNISVISVFSLFSVVGLALLNQCENMILPRYAARNKVTL